MIDYQCYKSGLYRESENEMFEVTFTFRDEKQEVVTKTKTLENWIELERLLHRIKTDYAKEYDNAFDVKEIKSL